MPPYTHLEAWRLAMRLKILYTLKYGSRLNEVECEWSAFTKRCISRRMPESETLQREVGVWMQRRNESQKGLDWHFTTKDARIRLKRLCPQIQI